VHGAGGGPVGAEGRRSGLVEVARVDCARAGGGEDVAGERAVVADPARALRAEICRDRGGLGAADRVREYPTSIL
jgi:hypothetical protein